MKQVVINQKTAPDRESMLRILKEETAMIDDDEEEFVRKGSELSVVDRKSSTDSRHSQSSISERKSDARVHKIGENLPRALVIDGPSLISGT
jgi:hypothetical protein